MEPEAEAEAEAEPSESGSASCPEDDDVDVGHCRAKASPPPSPPPSFSAFSISPSSTFSDPNSTKCRGGAGGALIASSSAAWCSEASMESISWKQSARARGTSFFVVKPSWARTREARYFWQNFATSLDCVGWRLRWSGRERWRKKKDEGGARRNERSKKTQKGKKRVQKKHLISLPPPVPIKDPEDSLGRRGRDVGEVRVLHGAAPSLLLLHLLQLVVEVGREREQVEGVRVEGKKGEARFV